MEQDSTICQSSVSHAREQTWLLTLWRPREREENASEGIPFNQKFSSGKDRSICFPTETFFSVQMENGHYLGKATSWSGIHYFIFRFAVSEDI